MAILEIDTDVLRQTVSMARHTNDAITDALNLLNQVVIHEEWNVDERRVLNQYTLDNRATAKNLQQNSTSFYHAIEQTSQLFLEAEQESIREINTLEPLISSIASVIPGIPISAGLGAKGAGAVIFNNVKSALGG